MGVEYTDSVKFNYAHAQYPGYSDRLVVKLSVDGGLTFPHTIFDKSGAALGTTTATSNNSVSYTHLDVYKRQIISELGIVIMIIININKKSINIKK